MPAPFFSVYMILLYARIWSKDMLGETAISATGIAPSDELVISTGVTVAISGI